MAHESTASSIKPSVIVTEDDLWEVAAEKLRKEDKKKEKVYNFFDNVIKQGSASGTGLADLCEQAKTRLENDKNKKSEKARTYVEEGGKILGILKGAINIGAGTNPLAALASGAIFAVVDVSVIHCKSCGSVGPVNSKHPLASLKQYLCTVEALPSIIGTIIMCS